MVTESNDDPDFVDSENDIDEDDDLSYEQNVTDDIQIEVEGRVFERAKDTKYEIDDLEYPTCEELRSDYESDEEVGYRFPEFNAETDMQNPNFAVGQKFRSIEEFRQAVRNYGAVNRYNVKFNVNDENRVQGVCKLGCQWKIWASKVKNTSTVHIKSYTPEHTCNRDQTNRHCTYLYLANMYIETFRVDPK
ncbi:SWIM-type domain-containing protein [Abeliophyllum distichum]|uniref:SWIM-type domain-containing protein n=1 Tax=Abeliophyllum distichum TaxID=126358 RepID=A0ABD1SWN0_9LAMI